MGMIVGRIYDEAEQVIALEWYEVDDDPASPRRDALTKDEARARYHEAYDRCIRACPDGLVSWALDEERTISPFGGNTTDDYNTAAEWLEAAVEGKADRGNMWDPSMI